MSQISWPAALFLLVTASAPSWAGDEIELGRRLYQEGVLPSGAPLVGTRNGGDKITGAQAACASCHRRSGMGAVEGTLLVPPVAGNFLFGRDGKHLVTLDQRRRKSFNQVHTPYTDASLALAVRSGINSDGRDLNVVMPHFPLDDDAMQALTAYLKQLSSAWSPGVTAESVRFATVITPDVEPERRQALLDVLRSAFVQKNASTVIASRAGGRRHMVTSAELVLGTERNWTLDVWELTGAPDTWAAQLTELYRKQPVFALVSGVSNDTWAPVHEFCQREQIPCWFPSVPLPELGSAFYSVYFSRGVTLEATLLADYLTEQKPRPARLIQIFRAQSAGQAAAATLAGHLTGTGIAVEARGLPSIDEKSLRAALAGIHAKDNVVLWLRSTDVAALDRIAPTAAASYFSATLAGAAGASVPSRWKPQAHLIYPYELPAQRQAGLAYFHSWLKLRKLPLLDEALQSEAYFAVNFLSDTLAEMLDNMHRDYLLERAESMLSQREGSKAEQEARERALLGRAGDLTSHYPSREQMPDTRGLVAIGPRTHAATNPVMASGTTIYPHLSLAQGQRFASKGGYIVRFDETADGGLDAESAWMVP